MDRLRCRATSFFDYAGAGRLWSRWSRDTRGITRCERRHLAQQRLDLGDAGPEFVAGREEVLGEDGIPVPPPRVREADDVEGLDRAADGVEELLAPPRVSGECDATAVLERGSEDRMVGGEEASGPMRPPEPAGRLGVTRRGEVEAGQGGEDFEVPEGGVERRNEERRRVGLEEREAVVLLERSRERGGVVHPLDRGSEPFDPEERERKPGRQQRVDERRR